MEEAGQQQQQHGARHTADGAEHVVNVDVDAAASVEEKRQQVIEVEMNNDNAAEVARAGSNQAEAMVAMARALSKQAEALSAAARALRDQVAEQARARSKQAKEARARRKQAEAEAEEAEAEAEEAEDEEEEMATFIGGCLLVCANAYVLWRWLS